MFVNFIRTVIAGWEKTTHHDPPQLFNCFDFQLPVMCLEVQVIALNSIRLASIDHKWTAEF